MAKKRWFCLLKTQVCGPFTDDQLVGLVAQGRVVPDTMVSPGGDENSWVRADAIGGLFGQSGDSGLNLERRLQIAEPLKPKTPPTPAPAAAPQPRKAQVRAVTPNSPPAAAPVSPTPQPAPVQPVAQQPAAVQPAAQQPAAQPIARSDRKSTVHNRQMRRRHGQRNSMLGTAMVATVAIMIIGSFVTLIAYYTNRPAPVQNNTTREVVIVRPNRDNGGSKNGGSNNTAEKSNRPNVKNTSRRARSAAPAIPKPKQLKLDQIEPASDEQLVAAVASWRESTQPATLPNWVEVEVLHAWYDTGILGDVLVVQIQATNISSNGVWKFTSFKDVPAPGPLLSASDDEYESMEGRGKARSEFSDRDVPPGGWVREVLAFPVIKKVDKYRLVLPFSAYGRKGAAGLNLAASTVVAARPPAVSDDIEFSQNVTRGDVAVAAAAEAAEPQADQGNQAADAPLVIGMDQPGAAKKGRLPSNNVFRQGAGLKNDGPETNGNQPGTARELIRAVNGEGGANARAKKNRAK